MAKPDPMVEHYAGAVLELFEDRVYDPSHEEIVARFYKGKPVGGEVTEGCRKRLEGIRDRLEKIHGKPAYLLSNVYYLDTESNYRAQPPATLEDARRCIPGGTNLKKWGIGLNTKEKAVDVIYLAYLMNNFLAANGKLDVNDGRVFFGVHARRLKSEALLVALQNAAKLLPTSHRALLEELRTRVAGIEVARGWARGSTPQRP